MPKTQRERKHSVGGRIENPRQLSAAFAIAVTSKSDSPHCWVARNGEESIFRTLQRILPQVDRNFLLG